MYNEDNQIRFKTSMLRSSLYDYSDSYILKRTITVAETAGQDQQNNAANKMVIFKNCAPFINCISKINYPQVDDAYDIDVIMPMYNLIEYSDDYSKKSGILWQYCCDDPALDAEDATTDFIAANAITDWFKIKEKITGETGDNDTKVK